ncbi:hypothetical protein ACFLTH_11070 [Bacteroidota bacterium]
MKKRGSFSVILTFIMLIVFTAAFFFFPVKKQFITTTVSEQIPYKEYGEYEVKEAYFVNESVNETVCGSFPPDVNIYSFPVNQNEWGDTYVQFKCHIFNKEDTEIEVTYEVSLGSRTAFAGSSPTGLLEPSDEVSIKPQQTYTSPAFYFNRFNVDSFEHVCKLISFDPINKCIIEEKDNSVKNYHVTYKNGTMTKYREEEKNVTEVIEFTLYNIIKSWFVQKN